MNLSQVKVRPENNFECSDKTLRKIRKIIVDTQGQAGALIRVLQKVQALIGYLPPAVLNIISCETQVPLSEIYGIVSFYHFFSMVPKGRHIIQVCMGTSCYVKGTQKTLDYLKKEHNLVPRGITADGKFSLDVVRCLGCCGLSPVIAVDKDIYRRVKPSQLEDILSSYK